MLRQQRQALIRRRMAWREADHITRKNLIIETCLRLLHDEGLAQVTIRRVAAHLGVGAMTLYTYVRGQDMLRREMIRRGFQMLSSHCRGCHAKAESHSWKAAATAYLQFARQNPNLYRLMFSTPALTREDRDIVRAGYDSLLERVRSLLAQNGLKGQELERATSIRTGIYWVSLHGLASIIIDERLDVIAQDDKTLLEELLPRIEPV